MSYLQAQDLCKTFGDRTILKNASFTLSPFARIALAGANGSGKSTLLKILAGEMAHDSGHITKKTALKLGYLSQDLIELTGKTVHACAESAFKEEHRLYEKSLELSEAASHPENAKLSSTMLIQQEEILEKLRFSGYFDREKDIGRILEGLAFTKDDLSKNPDTFSGGWQMRISLAIILLQKPEVLLLDEPTNYLDMETREWLLDWIKQYNGAIMLVSHDRYILDELVNEVFEIYRSKLTTYKGSYSQYEKARELELAEIMAQYKKQESRIENLTRFIERFGAKATKASQANSRKKELEKIDLIEIPDGLKKIDFQFPLAPPSGERVLGVTDLSKSYPGKKVIANISFDIMRGQKIALLGPNGAGKSTLLHIIAGLDSEFDGSFTRGHNTVFSFFAQEQIAQLNPEHTILEELEAHATIDQLPNLRSMLGAFLFHDDDVYKEISVLSGGERSRIALAKMLLKKANFLVLDEPTNHLDLTSKDALARALKSYGGTVLFVSHDKYFIRELCDRIFYIQPNPNDASSLVIYDGDFDYFQWKREGLSEAEIKPTEVKNQSQNQVDREEQKKKKTQLKKLQKQEEEIFAKIDSLESELNAIHDKFSDPQFYEKPELMKIEKQKEEKVSAELLNLQTLWEALGKEIELLSQE